MSLLGESNLLIISDRFPHAYDPRSSSFVKGQVDALRKYFKNIYVLSLIPYIPKVLSNRHFMHPRWRRDAFAHDYEYDNVKVYFIKYFNFPISIFRSRKGEEALNSVLKVLKKKYDLKFDLIHAHFTNPSGYVAAKLKEIYCVPFVLTVHEDHSWFLNEINSNDKKFNYIFHSADKIIRVNEKDLKEFGKLSIDKLRLISIPNGFSSNMFRPRDMTIARKELNLPQDRKILLNIANLEEYKGQEYLIKSMRYVLKDKTEVMLYLVGEGTQKERLQSLINEYDLNKNVILAGGGKPFEEISRWMNACDIFILPSLSESFGVVQIEAMACGKPVVATKNGGSEEIIINGMLGILVEPRDVSELAKGILKGLETKWDVKYIEEYAELFKWERIVERILEVYDEVLKI